MRRRVDGLPVLQFKAFGRANFEWWLVPAFTTTSLDLCPGGNRCARTPCPRAECCRCAPPSSARAASRASRRPPASSAAQVTSARPTRVQVLRAGAGRACHCRSGSASDHGRHARAYHTHRYNGRHRCRPSQLASRSCARPPWRAASTTCASRRCVRASRHPVRVLRPRTRGEERATKKRAPLADHRGAARGWRGARQGALERAVPHGHLHARGVRSGGSLPQHPRPRGTHARTPARTHAPSCARAPRVRLTGTRRAGRPAPLSRAWARA